MGDIIIGNKYEFGDHFKATYIQVTVNNQSDKTNSKELDEDLLTRAIENCQTYFWAKASYAVVFCVCRDSYKIHPNKSAFEKLVEKLKYTKKRNFSCPEGTIANAFSDNPIYNEHITEWDNRAAERIIKLRDALMKELKL